MDELTRFSDPLDFVRLARWLILTDDEFGYSKGAGAFESFDLIDQIRLKPGSFSAEWEAFEAYYSLERVQSLLEDCDES